MSVEPSGTPRDVEVNGITLRVVTWGEAAGPERTALLVHGITANSQAWSAFGPTLAARGWSAIAPDLRGRGRSAKPPHGYGIPFHVNDLLGLCDALELPTVHVVGHSLGAFIGLYLAALHPHRVGKLVLVDGGGTLPPDTLEAIAPALARLGQTYPSLDAYLAAMRATTAMPWDAYAEGYYRYDAEIGADDTAMSSVPKSAIAEETATNWAVRTDALPAFVKAPTLIVRATEGLLGRERGLILPADEAERLHGVISGSHLLAIPGTNHYTVVTAEAFTPEVLAFLDGGT